MKASETKAVAERYFDAVARRDVEAAVACWEPGGRENVRGLVDTTAPDGVREFLTGMLRAMPDARMEVLSMVCQRDRVAVHWRARGTFAGEPLMGVEATGSSIDLEGVDVLRVRDDRIVSNDAFLDNFGMARQMGLLPAPGSKQELRVNKLFNLKTRVERRLAAAPLEQVAHDVWVVRGGFPQRTMNVFLVKDGDGVLAFDAGIRQMAHAVAAAAAQLGGLTRVVLGHGHQDHRGTAPALGVDVLCHPDECGIAEGDGGFSTFDLEKLRPHARPVYRGLLPYWDGGPVQVAGTVQEGDVVGDGFEVVHIPGHAPGMIALFRERDRLALTSDAFYLMDVETARPTPPRVPHAAFTPDVEQARASVRKLAELRPEVCWPGHVGPLTGDVPGLLLTASES